MGWLIPENKLDSSARHIIENLDISMGNICISGYFDAGKSLLLMHLSRKIVHSIEGARILFLVFRNIDVEKYKIAFREIGLNFDIKTYWQFQRNPTHYDYILCDDIQMTSQTVLLQIEEKAKQVIVTINPNLRIFELDPITQSPTITIEIVREILHPKVFELTYIHHHNDYSIIDLAEQLHGFNLFNPQFYSSRKSVVKICEASCADEEVLFIINKSDRCISCGYTSAILLPTNRDMLNFVQALIKLKGKEPWTKVLSKWGEIDYNNLNQYLISNNINYQCLGSSYGQLSDLENKINIMTYHGSMGFKFDNVFMPYVNSGLYISSNDEISKNVFVLAMTRALHNLDVVFSGSMHPYLELIKDKCVRQHCTDYLNSNTNNDIFGI